MSRLRRPWLTSVVVLGVGLRLVGAVANAAANDDHIEVVHAIATERRLPSPGEFWESFQPPLYHVSVAVALMAMPDVSPATEVRVAQGVSCVAGLLTLVVLIAFVGRMPVSDRTARLVIALVSLNPALISASIQATNDAFVILFVTIATAAGYRFFLRPQVKTFVGMTAGVLLACIAKGNGLVVAVAVLLTLGGTLWRSPQSRRQVAGFSALFAVAFVAFVPVFGGYVTRYQTLGSALAINQAPAPPPHLFRETAERRSGITSVVHGFLTFRLVSMLEAPLIDGTPVDAGAPRHRTSLWSLLYGGANSVHYAYYPPAWRVDPGLAAWLVRTVVLLALLPTCLLVVGLVGAAVRLIKGIPVGVVGEWSAECLLMLVAAGYLGFVVVYGYRFRDFATMKAVFVCPAVLSFIVYFARGLDQCVGTVSWSGRILLDGVVLCLCSAYLADTVVLIYKLVSDMNPQSVSLGAVIG